MSALPVIQEMSEGGIYLSMSDGAYYVMSEDHNFVQIVVVGAMHFTPGEYIAALNDLLDNHYQLSSSEFMTYVKEDAKKVLERGFVSLVGKREN